MSKYIEDQILTLPSLSNGVAEIGDLWNCRTGSALSQNLFLGQNLTSSHISVIPVKSSTYSVNAEKGFGDNTKQFLIEGSLTAGLFGVLEITVELLFNKLNGRKYDEDEVIVNYEEETFRMKTNPIVRQVVDSKVMDMILNGKLPATHVVTEMTLGGQATASIRVNHLKTDHVLEVSGSITASIDIIIACASVKAGAGLKEKEHVDNLDTRITLISRPPLASKSAPKTMSEFRESISHIRECLLEQKHFLNFPQVYGVPIKFRLVPLHLLFDIATERIYKQLSDDVMTGFNTALATAREILGSEFIKSRVLRGDTRLQSILKDGQSELASQIEKDEETLKVLSSNFLSEGLEIIGHYMIGQKSPADVSRVTAAYEKGINLPEILLKVRNYVVSGKEELFSVRLSDGGVSGFRYFTNKVELVDWLATSKNSRILLQTAPQTGECSAGPIMALDQLSKPLQTLGVGIGLVMPSISEDFSLSLQIEGKTVKYLGSARISFVLQAISVALGQSGQVFTRFYGAIATIKGLHLPFKDQSSFKDLPNLVSCLENSVMRAKLPETPLQLREHMLEEDGKWKFVLLTDALNSLLDSTRLFLNLMTKITPDIRASFIVGRIGLGHHSASPAVLVFLNGSLVAVLYDGVDVHLLAQILASGRQGISNEELVSLQSSVGNSIYPKRIRFLQEFCHLLNEPLPRNIPDPGESTVSENVKNLLQLVSCIVKNDPLATIRLLGDFAIKEDPHIAPIFKKHIRHDVTDSEFKAETFTILGSTWTGLHSDFKNYLHSREPLLGKIHFALESLKPFLFNLEEELDKILSHPECPSNFRDKLEAVQLSPSEKKERWKKSLEVLEAFEKNLNKDEALKESTPSDFVFQIKATSDMMQVTLTRLSMDSRKMIDDLVSDVRTDGGCPDYLKSKLVSATAPQEEVRARILFTTLDSYLQSAFQNPKDFHSLALFKYLERITQSGFHSLGKSVYKFTLLQYFRRLPAQELSHPSVYSKIEDYIQKAAYIQVAGLLERCAVDVHTYKIASEFHLFNSPNQLCSLLQRLGSTLATPELWKLPKFVHLIRQGLVERSNAILSELEHHLGHLTEELDFIPEDIYQALQRHFGLGSRVFQEELGDESKCWEDEVQLLEDLQVFTVRSTIPKPFLKQLRESLVDRPDLTGTLLGKRALYYWHEEDQYFQEPWDLITFRDAISAIMTKDRYKSSTKLCFDVVDDTTKSEPGEELTPIRYKSGWEFLSKFNVPKLKRIENINAIERWTNFERKFCKILQYTLQHLQFGSAQGSLETIWNTQQGLNCPKIKYHQIIEAMCTLASQNPILSQQLVLTLASHKKPMPLVVANLQDSHNKWLTLFPALYNFPLTSSLKTAHLFVDSVPLILCFNVGHSTGVGVNLLNSMLETSSHFQKYEDVVNGFTEMVLVNPDNCKVPVFSKKYPTFLLAFLHGDCLLEAELVTFLKPCISSYIAFHGPDGVSEIKTRFDSLQKIIGLESHCNHVLIHPANYTNDKIPIESFIFKASESKEQVETQLSNLFRETLDSVNLKQLTKAEFFSIVSRFPEITSIPLIETAASSLLIEKVTKSRTFSLKTQLNEFITESEAPVPEILSIFINIFQEDEWKLGLHHVENELKKFGDKKGYLCPSDFLRAASHLQLTTEDAVMFNSTKKCIQRMATAFLSDSMKLQLPLPLVTEDVLLLKNFYDELDKVLPLLYRYTVVAVIEDGTSTNDLINPMFGFPPGQKQAQMLEFRICTIESEELDGILLIRIPPITEETAFLTTLLLGLSNLVLVDISDFESIKSSLNSSLLNSCRLKPLIRPNFLLLDHSNDIRDLLTAEVEKIEEIAKLFETQLGIWHYPQEKLLYARFPKVVKISTLSGKEDLQVVSDLRNALLDSCIEVVNLEPDQIWTSFATFAERLKTIWEEIQNIKDYTPVAAEFTDANKKVDQCCAFFDAIDSVFHNHRNDIFDKVLHQGTETDLGPETLLEPIIKEHLAQILSKCVLSSSKCSECTLALLLQDSVAYDTVTGYVSKVRETTLQEIVQKCTTQAWKSVVKLQDNPLTLKYEASLRKLVIPPWRRFITEIDSVYGSIGFWMKENFKKPQSGVIDQVLKITEMAAFSGESIETINWEEEDWIEAEIEDAIKFLFMDLDEQIFQPGMVRGIKAKLMRIAKKFEERFGKELLPEFKWNMHALGLQRFLNVVLTRQEVWDKENDPLVWIINELGKN